MSPRTRTHPKHHFHNKYKFPPKIPTAS
jgi:hypothetical protein